MLLNTFCHIGGIGIGTEQKLWNAGIRSWDMFHGQAQIPLSRRKVALTIPLLKESAEHLHNRNPLFFSQSLPVNLQWRLFPHFRDEVAYFDIETTGLDCGGDEITTIALYDGQAVHTYVNGQNLHDFVSDIQRFKIIISYNGRCFDVPFIEHYFRIKLSQVHIDLRYLLKSLGFAGGLKECERQMGIERGELKDVDGFYAVMLWHDYKRNKIRKSLETLLAYNSLDARNLETLMVQAYNLKLKTTPFYEINRI
jgi:uncharacterized protein YprB with RNaseH-like and TPR domain